MLLMITTITNEFLDGISRIVQTKKYSDGSVFKCTINPVTGIPEEYLESKDSDTSDEAECVQDLESMMINIVSKF
mgnify:CR=1 FL=1